MAYSVILRPKAQKQLDKLDRQTQKILAHFIEKNLNGCENPRKVPNGRNLEGIKNGWRRRVGVYRILGIIDDDKIIIEIIKIGSRRDVYRKASYDTDQSPTHISYF